MGFLPLKYLKIKNILNLYEIYNKKLNVMLHETFIKFLFCTVKKFSLFIIRDDIFYKDVKLFSNFHLDEH